jgi:hypothetical protein
MRKQPLSLEGEARNDFENKFGLSPIANLKSNQIIDVLSIFS